MRIPLLLLPSLSLLLRLLFLPLSTAFQTRSYHSRSRPCLAVAASPSHDEDTAIRLNPCIADIQPSQTVEIFSKVKQLQAQGIDVTSLCVGEPDFLPPQAVMNALHDAVDDGDVHYTAVTGTVDLRRAIAKDLKQRKGVKYDYNTEIVVANGAKQCVFQGLWAICGAGDKVLVPAPYWPSYPEMVSLTGATPIILKSRPETGYLVTADQWREALQQHPETKLIILCNPSNPTGGVYQQQHLKELCTVLQDYPNVVVLADEIYERLVYDDMECPSLAAQPDMFHRTITINGFSKAYSMTGLRLGYLAAPAQIARAVTILQGQLTSCAGSLSQAAGVAALNKVSQEELQLNVDELQRKRDYVLEQLSTMPHVHVHVPPTGAFYVLPDVSKYCNDGDTQLCLDLLNEKQLALVPGSSFGAPGTVRISYATSMPELEIAMNKLSSFLNERNDE